MHPSAGRGGGGEESVISGRGQARFRSMEHLISDTLERAGARHIRFNSLTANVCVRELQRMARAEGVPLPDADAARLVEASRCDLASAICALELQAKGRRTGPNGANASNAGAKRKTRAAGPVAAVALWHERDLGLSLFHALGKILHNKRFDENGERVVASSR
jgi:DNA polymerase III delta prime subunit